MIGLVNHNVHMNIKEVSVQILTQGKSECGIGEFIEELMGSHKVLNKDHIKQKTIKHCINLKLHESIPL